MSENGRIEVPADLPVPKDDGGCSHLISGMPMPSVELISTSGTKVNIASATGQRSVLFFYPKTGKPGVPPPDGWKQIPGAWGCTVESYSFRDNFEEFRKLGVAVFGVSTQTNEEQKEFASRSAAPYEILSDSDLKLAHALNLPTFTAKGLDGPMIKRLTIVASDGKIEKVFYPVFPPDKNAKEVLDFLKVK